MNHVCSGCQPKRNISGPKGLKFKGPAAHHCQGNGCLCGSCKPFSPVTDQQYRTWMAKLGDFYIDNTKTLIEMVKQGKLKPEMEKEDG